MIADVISIHDLREANRHSMLCLMQKYFEGVSDAVFSEDLSNKSHVLLLRDAKEEVCGFTTLALEVVEYSGQPIRVVYSGDTIVQANSRSSALMFKAWIQFLCHQQGLLDQEVPLVWLLIVSGFRTFRILPTFFHHFLPSPNVQSSRDLISLRDFLATHRYGPQYDRTRGIVTLRNPQPLRNCSNASVARDAIDEHFQALNPGHSDGDELVCLAPLKRDNLNPLGRRMLRPS